MTSQESAPDRTLWRTRQKRAYRRYRWRLPVKVLATLCLGSLVTPLVLTWWFAPVQGPRSPLSVGLAVESQAFSVSEKERGLTGDTALAHTVPSPDVSGAERAGTAPDASEAGDVGEGRQDNSMTPPSVSVQIHYRAGSVSGREAARLIADEVRKTGLEVHDVRPVASAPTMREIRHSDVAATEAERLASQFRKRWGHAWRVRPDEDSGPQQAGGALEQHAGASVLEVWLPHR